MRILGGQFKGRRFNPPAKKWPTRPTTDYSKEGLYNILMNRIDFEETKFLDLFGGTGNHCYEMISRGCTDATYVDRFGGCVSFANQMVEKLGIANEMHIIKMDVFKYIKSCQESYDLIFAGPPYALKTIDTIPTLIIEQKMLTDNGFLVLEHNPNVSFDNHKHKFDQRHYGQTIFSFFKE